MYYVHTQKLKSMKHEPPGAARLAEAAQFGGKRWVGLYLKVLVFEKVDAPGVLGLEQ